MAHWDVTTELRGEHGKWSKSGILHRAAEEAKQAGKEKESGKIEAGHRVAYKGGNSVGTVHHIDEKGVPHVVWDRGRGKPVRTPVHHLSHVGEQHKATPKPGAPERGAHETPSQERHLDETLRKLAAGKKPSELTEAEKAANRRHNLTPRAQPRPGHERTGPPPTRHPMAPEPSLAGRPAAEKRRAALKAGTEKPFMRGERVKHSSGKVGVATGNEKDDPYGNGRRIVEVRWDKGRNSTVYAETLSREPKAGATPGTGGHSPDELRRMIAEMEAKQKAKTEAENKARFPGGSTTIRSGPMGGTESAAATRGLRGGGMQATRSFEEVSKEYDTANATLHRMLDRGGSELAINARRREISRLEGELRGMGARRSFGTNWEMPPKKGTPEHAAEMRKREYSSIVEQLHDQHREAGAPLYSPEELAGVRSADIKAQLNSGQKAIVVKVPSGSEIHMSPEMARQLLQKNKDTAALASVKRLTDKGIMTPQKSAGPRLPASDYGKMTLEQLQGLEKIYQQPLQRGGNAAQAQHQMTELTAIQAEMQKRQRRARQQGRLAEAAGRRGITNRRKAT